MGAFEGGPIRSAVQARREKESKEECSHDFWRGGNWLGGGLSLAIR